MKRLLALALFAPTFALSQEANEISYDYFDLDYTASNWDAGAVDFDAGGLGGEFSIDFREQFFLFGDYRDWEFDDLGDAGSVSKTFGIGKAFPIGQRWSVYAGAGVRALDLDLGLGNVEDEGAVVIGGARFRPGDAFELRIGAENADLSDTGIGDSTITVGGDLHLTDVVALTVELSENDEDVSALTLGLRFYPTRDSSAARQRR